MSLHNGAMHRRELRAIADPALVRDLAAALRGRDTFAALPPAVLTALVESAALLELEPGEALIRENDAAAPEVYLLVEGALAVQSQGRPIARLDKPGDVVGETAVLMQSRRTADVLADSAARALAVPASVLSRPEFAELAAGLRQAMLRDDWIQY